MAVEVGVICPRRPDPQLVTRLVGPLIGMILRSGVIYALCDERKEAWTISWDSVSAVVLEIPPGSHEFADSWFLSVAPGERAIDLSFLLAVVTAAAAAIAVDGRVLDESSLVGGGNIGGGELLVRAAGGPEHSVAAALTALGSHVWSQ
jgi:hypothetical protein